MILAHKGVAHPWQCDVLGHLTTRFYVAMFDDSSYHLLHGLFGWAGASDNSGELGWVDVQHVINYQAEVKAGELLEVRAGVVKLGGKSMSVRYEMTNVAKQEIAATLDCTMVLFDLKGRQAVKIPDHLRQQAEAHLIPQE
ncbi:MAG: thioesterase family protein [Pseudomonadota bacterium]